MTAIALIAIFAKGRGDNSPDEPLLPVDLPRSVTAIDTGDIATGPVEAVPGRRDDTAPGNNVPRYAGICLRLSSAGNTEYGITITSPDEQKRFSVSGHSYEIIWARLNSDVTEFPISIETDDGRKWTDIALGIVAIEDGLDAGGLEQCGYHAYDIYLIPPTGELIKVTSGW